MRDNDLLRQLAATNPVTDADLNRLDPAAGATLREAIVRLSAPQLHDDRRRVGRRAFLAGGLALGMAGGGLAYAAVERGWYEGGGGADGLTCVSEWFDPTRESPEDIGITTGGPALTGDPVADCQHYQELSDRPPITDPVAFRWDSPSVYVAPRAQVPPGAELLEPDVDDGPVHELWLSVNDFVAGIGARCMEERDAVAAVRAELDRLGLRDWQVELAAPEPERPIRECARVQFAVDPVVEGGSADTARSRTLLVVPAARGDRDDLRGNGVDEFVFELRDALRAEVGGRCLDVTEAREVVLDALGPAHHWPTATVVDESAECTRAYLVAGGSVQVTLYGPEPSEG